jgi:hypothetical protein
MKVAASLACAAMLLLALPAASQPQSLGDKDTLAAAQLSAKELRRILEAIEQSAYDTPDSWTKELRARRVDLGASPGIVLQGTKLLCGGTGNCQLFIFRKVNDQWVSLFGRDEAPLAESFEFGPGVTHGIKDLTLATNSSAQSTQRIKYKFDGQIYRSTS